MNPITYQQIAQEAVENNAWKICPRRAQRALRILIQHKPGTMLMLARRDENDMPIQSDSNIWIVRASSNGRGWYFIRPDDHTCTCPDHKNGHICKHRLAVYLYTQQIERTRQAVIDEARKRANGGDIADLLLEDLGF